MLSVSPIAGRSCPRGNIAERLLHGDHQQGLGSFTADNMANDTSASGRIPEFHGDVGLYRDWRRHQVAVFQKRSGTTYVVSNSHTINGTGYRTIPGSGPKAIRFGQQALGAAVEAVQAKARELARSSTHSVAWVVVGDFNMTKEAARSLLQEMPRKIVEGAVLAGHDRRDLVVAGGELACIETLMQNRINLLPPC